MSRSGWVVVGVLALALWLSLVLPRYHQPSRNREDCEHAQQLWDGQMEIVGFLDRMLAGTRGDLRLEALREDLGPRPTC